MQCYFGDVNNMIKIVPASSLGSLAIFGLCPVEMFYFWPISQEISLLIENMHHIYVKLHRVHWKTSSIFLVCMESHWSDMVVVS